MNKKINQKSIREDVKNGEATNQCLICLEDDPNVLEEHHIFSRAASGRTELLCKNCHAPITYEQNKVPPKSRSKDASYLEKIAYQLISIGALLREIGIQLIKVGHELRYYVQKCGSSLHS
jgi:hypothetical protein